MKLKKIIAAGVLVLAIVTAALTVRHFHRAEEQQPEYVLSYAENQAEDYPTTLGAKRFAELVEARTGGRIRIVVSAQGLLGTEKDVIQQMQFGGIDFARVSLSQLAEYIPELNVLQMPYLYTGSDHMWRVLDGRIGDEFLAEIDAYDLEGLSWYDAGARNFYSATKPITCLEDVAGMRIRVQESELMADLVEALGATAVPISYENVYSALEKGTVDGAENNWPSYESTQHYEVAKYYTIDEHTRVPEVQICSQMTWSKISEADRDIIRKCAEDSALYERELWIKREENSKKVALANGVEIEELSVKEKQKFQDAMMGVYEKYCGDDMDIIDEIIAEGRTE
ncbi:MAG: TRAP transporter substrate-binding protein [Lachnospiraceae bacterium]|nr:TRAP transporter substrate-binding protein [Lachnospiraceae bacterium]